MFLRRFEEASSSSPPSRPKKRKGPEQQAASAPPRKHADRATIQKANEALVGRRRAAGLKSSPFTGQHDRLLTSVLTGLRFVTRTALCAAGVSWQKDVRKWKVGITVGGKFKHGGSFYDEEEAARAYDAQARLHFPRQKSDPQRGWHALNFPTAEEQERENERENAEDNKEEEEEKEEEQEEEEAADDDAPEYTSHDFEWLSSLTVGSDLFAKDKTGRGRAYPAKVIAVDE